MSNGVALLLSCVATNYYPAWAARFFTKKPKQFARWGQHDKSVFTVFMGL